MKNGGGRVIETKSIKFTIFLLCSVLLCGCTKERHYENPSGPHFSLMTYNINWGGGQPERTIEVIRRSNSDIVCLQETHTEWQCYLQQELGELYPFMEFRETPNRAGGGLAFLSKTKGRQIDYIPSENTFFDAWIMQFDTAAGPVEILNVHLHPPVNESGSFGVSGYFGSQDRRSEEIQRFYPYFTGEVPRIVAGDFNEGDDGDAVKWLADRGMTDALAEFDRSTKTWRWKTSLMTLQSRLDHIVYSSELYCFRCQVIPYTGSDHYPLCGLWGLNETRDD